MEDIKIFAASSGVTAAPLSQKNTVPHESGQVKSIFNAAASIHSKSFSCRSSHARQLASSAPKFRIIVSGVVSSEGSETFPWQPANAVVKIIAATRNRNRLLIFTYFTVKFYPNQQ